MSTRQASTKNTPNSLPLIGLAHRNVDLVGMNPWLASYRDSMLKYTRQGGGGNGGTDIDMSTYNEQMERLLASSESVEKMLTELLNRANAANDQRAETALKEMQSKMKEMKELHKIELQEARKALENYKKAISDAELAQDMEQDVALQAREADLAEQEAKLAEQQAKLAEQQADMAAVKEELSQLFYEMPQTPQDNNVDNFSDSNLDQEEDNESDGGYVDFVDVDEMTTRRMEERAQKVEKLLQEERDMADNFKTQQEWWQAEVEKIRAKEKEGEEEEEEDYADANESAANESEEDDSEEDDSNGEVQSMT